MVLCTNSLPINVYFSPTSDRVRLVCIYSYYASFFSVALRPNAGHGLLIREASRSHTTTHHSR